MSLEINRLRIDIAGTLTNDLSEDGEAGGAVSLGIEYAFLQAFTDGDGSGEADAYWASKGRELASGADETIDLYDFAALDIGAGAGLDPVGQAITLAGVVGFIIYNRPDSVGTLTVGAEGSAAAWNSPFAGEDDEAGLVVPPGAIRAFADPITALAVADSSNHLLKIAAAGGAVKYDIIIIGRRASE